MKKTVEQKTAFGTEYIEYKKGRKFQYDKLQSPLQAKKNWTPSYTNI